jgi:polyisoprenoid-binding protein YceI
MRGVQKEITFDATITDAAPYSLKAEFTINRKLWGIEYAGKADDLIKDDVAIIANLTFK